MCRGLKETDNEVLKMRIPKDTEKRTLYQIGKELLQENGYHEIGMDHFALKQTVCMKPKINCHRNFMGYSSSKHS
jgi:oxygen-independent coproporphyrinogen-3 oxidase